MMYAGIATVLLFALVFGARSVNAAAAANESIEDMIRRTAIAYGRSPALMLALCRVESSFNPSAINPSDPSYGLFQIQTFWLPEFGYPRDSYSLMDGPFNTEIACRIVTYFQDRGFRFPSEADIYNVGETQWGRGVRNMSYRTKVVRYFNEYSV